MLFTKSARAIDVSTVSRVKIISAARNKVACQNVLLVHETTDLQASRPKCSRVNVFMIRFCILMLYIIIILLDIENTILVSLTKGNHERNGVWIHFRSSVNLQRSFTHFSLHFLLSFSLHRVDMSNTQDSDWTTFLSVLKFNLS